MRLIFILTLAFAARTGMAQGTLTITVSNINHNKGIIRACLFTSSKTYLGKGEVCTELPATKGTVILEFRELPLTRYALVVYHDENANGKIDLGLFRIPTEPYGFPGNPSAFFGPPSFEDAVIEIAADTSVAIRL